MFYTGAPSISTHNLDEVGHRADLLDSYWPFLEPIQSHIPFQGKTACRTAIDGADYLSLDHINYKDH